MKDESVFDADKNEIQDKYTQQLTATLHQLELSKDEQKLPL